MPRTETVISAFISSPSDVKDERLCLEEIVQEINGTWSRKLGVRVALISWDKSVIPGIGDNPQDVINKQIKDDYDIFIGIMWHRFGSPTTLYGSGTEEEFYRALDRYKSDDQSVHIMFYFKNEPVPPSEINPEQLAKVQNFKKDLRNLGVLFKEYKGIDEFRQISRIHLSGLLTEWRNENIIVTSKTVDDISEHPDEDYGIIDLMEIFEQNFSNLMTTTDRMNLLISNLAQKFGDNTENLNKLRTGSTDVSIRDAKALLSLAAQDIDDYVVNMRNEIPVFDRSLTDGMEAFTKIYLLSSEFSDGDLGDSESTIETIRTVGNQLAATVKSIEEFRDTIQGLPRLTKELNKAKRNATDVVEELIIAMEKGINLIREAESSLMNIDNTSP